VNLNPKSYSICGLRHWSQKWIFLEFFDVFIELILKLLLFFIEFIPKESILFFFSLHHFLVSLIVIVVVVFILLLHLDLPFISVVLLEKPSQFLQKQQKHWKLKSNVSFPNSLSLYMRIPHWINHNSKSYICIIWTLLSSLSESSWSSSLSCQLCRFP